MRGYYKKVTGINVPLSKFKCMKVGIYGRLVKEGDSPFFQLLFQLLNKYGVSFTIFDGFNQQLIQAGITNPNTNVFHTHHDIREQNIDLLFSLGGDGTLLDTISLIRDSEIPILGINSGRLGFLTGIGKENMQEAVDDVLNGRFVIDKRNLIQLDTNKPIFGDNPVALNEFTIHKKDTSSMITIHTYLNGEFLTSYWADGLIVSTPTGSTAYNLSCGGPILIPSSDNFVITPVAPHNLNIRPVVIPNNSILSFEIEGRNAQFLCTLDSRIETIDPSFQLAVRKADYCINLARLHDTHFLDTISKKLNWGKDERN
jgi:NAD+ kinase